MSRALSGDPMEVDSNSTDPETLQNEQHQGTFLKDEADDPFVVVSLENLREAPLYKHPNKPVELASESNDAIPSVVRSQDAEEERTNSDTNLETRPMMQNGNVEKTSGQRSKIEETEKADLERQFQEMRKEHAGEIKDLRSKVTSLESIHQPVSAESRENIESILELGIKERQKYEDTIRALRKANEEVEENVKTLLFAQEQSIKHQTEVESRYRLALNHIEKEKIAREESELNMRSEITTVRGAYQKEKERAQKLMKTMAEMQSADPHKLDNTNITSAVKELRYNIKNWTRAQKLIPSPPAQGLLSAYASRALGGREKGPNYEFLREISPMYQEYTESSQDFKWLLQAYIWKRIVDIIFVDDHWAGTRKPLNDEDMDHRLQMGYRSLKIRLEPDENSSQEYTAQYHEWRSNTSRLISQHISPERRKRTIDIVREEILRPIYRSTSDPHSPQEILNAEDLDGVIESAMRLGASMAQQRAFFAFEFVPVGAYGKLEFNPQIMQDPYPIEERWDSRTHYRAVWMGTAPRLLKWGTSEGTGFDGCVQLLEGEVETRIVQKKFVVRRQGVN